MNAYHAAIADDEPGDDLVPGYKARAFLPGKRVDGLDRFSGVQSSAQYCRQLSYRYRMLPTISDFHTIQDIMFSLGMCS